ncbi:MAG: biotin carboxylase N-terminal domain-containing protein [Natrialbaceae archaeon]|nr:biotin carboxylase N-terminal domain-containing protein [Natrialbaceae archaeon]
MKNSASGLSPYTAEADKNSGHVRYADEAYNVGPARAADSYLDHEAVIEAARKADADAIHPGYGFLAENAEFAGKVEAEDGITWIGPSSEAMEQLGEKTKARTVMQAADVPIVPGTTEPVTEPEEVEAFAEDHGYPVAIKAEGGGGGRGMKVVREPSEVDRPARECQTRGRGLLRQRLGLPRALSREPTPHRGPDRRRHPRQRPPSGRARLLAPAPPPEGHRGGALPGPRRRPSRADRRGRPPRGATQPTTSTPAPSSSSSRRTRRRPANCSARRELLLPRGQHADPGRTLRHRGDHRDRYRQVADPGRRRGGATVRPGRGDLRWPRDGVSDQRRECGEGLRAGDRWRRCSTYDPPGGIGVRMDDALRQGDTLVTDYDSMIAKLIVHGSDRERVSSNARFAPSRSTTSRASTTIVPFHRLMLTDEAFVAGEHTTKYLDEELDQERIEEAQAQWGPAEPAATDEDEEVVEREFTVEVNGKRFEVNLEERGAPPHADECRRRAPSAGPSPPVAAAADGGGDSGVRGRRGPTARSSRPRCRGQSCRSMSPRATRSSPATCSASSRP